MYERWPYQMLNRRMALNRRSDYEDDQQADFLLPAVHEVAGEAVLRDLHRPFRPRLEVHSATGCREAHPGI